MQILDEAGQPVTALVVRPGETLEISVANGARFPHNLFIGPQDALAADQTAGRLQGATGGPAQEASGGVGARKHRRNVVGEVEERLASGVTGGELHDLAHPRRVQAAPVGEEGQLVGGEVGEPGATHERPEVCRPERDRHGRPRRHAAGLLALKAPRAVAARFGQRIAEMGAESSHLTAVVLDPLGHLAQTL